MSDNGGLFDELAPVTQEQLRTVLEETEDILTEMKTVINLHAEILQAHKYILERFVPKPLFDNALKEYYDARSKEIDTLDAEPETDAQKLN